MLSDTLWERLFNRFGIKDAVREIRISHQEAAAFFGQKRANFKRIVNALGHNSYTFDEFQEHERTRPSELAAAQKRAVRLTWNLVSPALGAVELRVFASTLPDTIRPHSADRPTAPVL